MKKAVWSGVATAVFLLAFTSTAFAQASANGSIDVSATVSARAKLTLGAASITWADADPDSVTEYTSDVTLGVKARTSFGSSVTLTVAAAGDFTNGSANIPWANFTWTVAGDASLSAGTVNTVAQTVGTWTNSVLSTAGTQTYHLQNSWTYSTGSYTVTLNYTLSAP